MHASNTSRPKLGYIFRKVWLIEGGRGVSMLVLYGKGLTHVDAVHMHLCIPFDRSALRSTEV